MKKVSSVSKTPISSSNRKFVFLREWWLIKVDEMESKLGVGGYTNKETLGSRGMRLLGSASRYNDKKHENEFQVFDSAPIAKRLDSNTLEAVDGIIITISGLLNKPHTLSYGFSPQVCDIFLCGFPCTWEDDYASARSGHDKSCAAERSLPVSFNNLPVTRVRDLLMSTSTGESESNCAITSIIIRDILKQQSIQQQSIQQQTTVNRTTDSDEKAPTEQEDSSTSNATTTVSSGTKRKLTTSQKRYTSGTKQKLTTSPKRYTLRSMQAR